jgi:hypothetical protein
MVMCAFVAVAWQNVIGLNIIIWFIFKRWSGLYFYMLLVASWGIVLHQLGFLLMFFGIIESFTGAFVILSIGWYSMVGLLSLVVILDGVADG